MMIVALLNKEIEHMTTRLDQKLEIL